MNTADARRGSRDLRRLVVGSSAAFSILLTLLAWGLLRLTHTGPASVFATASVRGAAAGLAGGIAAGVAGVTIVSRLRVFASLRRLARDAIEGIEPGFADLVIVSVAAGWGEELFFRGALQPLAGVWLTSVAFVILHGAYRFRGRGGLAFAVFLYGMSTGLGFVRDAAGLPAAMLAHTAYDLTVLVGIRQGRPRAPRGAESTSGRRESLTDPTPVRDAGPVDASTGRVDPEPESQGGNEV